MKIKNQAYRNFLDSGIIQTISNDDFKAMLDQVSAKEKKKPKIARSFLIFLYITGATPLEALNVRAKDIYKDKSYFCIKLVGVGLGKKKRLPRIIRIQAKNQFIKELYDYAVTTFSDVLIFHSFSTKYTRKHTTKKGFETFRTERTDGLRYYFKKWFDDKYTPYFLRHNRFSKLSEEGLTLEQLRMVKGCRSYESIVPYIHMSQDLSKKIAKKFN